MDAAAADLAAGASGDTYAVALDRWLSLGGADLDERAGEVAAELGLGVGLDMPMTGLSGGQAARVGLAALLLSRFDVLLLDEPTNDLDLDGLARLETFVLGLRSPAVIVSHDREFLARTVNRIVELDLAQQKVGVYEAGTSRTSPSGRWPAGTRARRTRSTTRSSAPSRTGPRPSGTGWRRACATPVARATTTTRSAATSGSRPARSRPRRPGRPSSAIERLDVVDEPRKEWDLRMTIAAAPRSGTVVASATGAVVRRGSFTLGPVDAQVDWADRVAITGPNGSGKTTLLGALLGRIPVDEGSAGLGSGVRVGEIDQARGLFLGPVPLARAFGDAMVDWAESDVRTLLAKFGLTRHHATRPADSLSPGERTRAALALLQAREVNLLVLDEPTNHLDLAAIEQLEEALESFGGTVLLVTHDRRMLDTVRTTRRWALDAGRLTER